MGRNGRGEDEEITRIEGTVRAVDRFPDATEY